MIDPLADKLLTSAALISLVQMDLAPAWMVAVIIGREFAVTALRSLAYARGVADARLAARQDQDGGAGGGDPGADPRRTDRQAPFFLIGQVALWVVVVTALVSAADYFRRFNVILNPRVADFNAARESRTGRTRRVATYVSAPRRSPLRSRRRARS